MLSSQNRLDRTIDGELATVSVMSPSVLRRSCGEWALNGPCWAVFHLVPPPLARGPQGLPSSTPPHPSLILRARQRPIRKQRREAYG